MTGIEELPPGMSAALDALAIATTVARQPGAENAWTAGMQAAYSDPVQEIAKRSSATLKSALRHAGVKLGSRPANAAVAAHQQSIAITVEDVFKLLGGSMLVSVWLLEQLAKATNTDPDMILRSAFEGGHHA